MKIFHRGLLRSVLCGLLMATTIVAQDPKNQFHAPANTACSGLYTRANAQAPPDQNRPDRGCGRCGSWRRGRRGGIAQEWRSTTLQRPKPKRVLAAMAKLRMPNHRLVPKVPPNRLRFPPPGFPRRAAFLSVPSMFDSSGVKVPFTA
jgi:hypothetical protein